MSFQDLVDGFNQDLMEEANTVHTIKSGTYVGQVLKVEERANRFDGSPELNLHVQLLSRDLEKEGLAFVTITSIERRSKSGKQALATKLFYQLAKAMLANSTEEVLDGLPGFTFTCYVQEYFNGKRKEFPEELQLSTVGLEDWQPRQYVKFDDDKIRAMCLDAGMKSRVEVQSIGVFRD